MKRYYCTTTEFDSDLNSQKYFYRLKANVNKNGGYDINIVIDDDNENKWLYNGQYMNPCDCCPNNPLNNPFASGFCNCTIVHTNRIFF